MEDFKIITDTTADLPEAYIQENGLGIMVLPYIVDGVSYGGEQKMEVKEFYDRMRGGMMPTTSQVNPETAKEYLNGFLEESRQLLVLSFSSGLSGTCGNVNLAAKEIMEERPDCRIVVIDTLCVSLGEGLLVHKAVQLKKQGKSLEETARWVEEHKENLVHVFTVDDLFHLHRGGRVSRATAIVGTLAGIKPLLHVDGEGHLTAVGKVRGRKKSLQSLVDMMEKQMGSWRGENDCVFISHGDCAEDADYVRQMVKERFGIDDFLINEIGPTIGAHSGPGTVALFFMGDVR
ncbi:MAG TPA: DegV family protein [Candidatus Eisenbergiella merdavium]|uniref:DegV family protein n=1 Tax=Candidatus Eisenbergiella merdavium TaxID=2838551 RepID=A0A9D2NEB6_9FIRM|nr:DegV family protein [Candidatus Eisenbergiella merdavium]